MVRFLDMLAGVMVLTVFYLFIIIVGLALEDNDMSYNNMPTITPAHSAVSVGSSSTAIVSANSERKYLLLINDSDETIYVKLGAAAVANEGIRLAASGGSLELSVANGNLYAGAINGICASGGKTLLVTEGE